MPITIAEDSLISKSIRVAAGIRKINPAQTSTNQTDDDGNFIAKIWNGVNKIGGFLLRKALDFLGRIASWTWTTFWSKVHSAVDFVMNFNWNITDEQLDAQVKNQWDSVGSSLGGWVGNTIGWIGCGVLPGVAVMAFNEGMGAYILKNVGEEFIDEFSSNLGAVVNSAFRAASQQTFAWAFKNTRKWLKQPGNIFAQAIFGENYAKVMQNWAKKDAPSFTFADYRDEQIEKIPNTFWRNFVEEAVEEAWDACIEAGYVVAMSADSYIASQKLMNQQILGKERTVEITPNREAESERIVLTGNEKVLKPMIVQTLAQHKLIENRDVGQIIGEAAETAKTANPQTQRMVIQLFSHKSPPWKRKNSGVKYQPVTIKIPDVPRSKFDFEKIKEALGGENGYTYGNWRATAKLDNGRQIVIYADTKIEAEKRTKALLTLTDAKLLSLNCSEELDEGVRAEKPELQKKPVQVYPAYVTFFVNRPSSQGRTTKEGKVLKERSARLDLWTSKKPNNWDEEIASLFEGAND